MSAMISGTLQLSRYVSGCYMYVLTQSMNVTFTLCINAMFPLLCATITLCCFTCICLIDSHMLVVRLHYCQCQKFDTTITAFMAD